MHSKINQVIEKKIKNSMCVAKHITMNPGDLKRVRVLERLIFCGIAFSPFSNRFV